MICDLLFLALYFAFESTVYTTARDLINFDNKSTWVRSGHRARSSLFVMIPKV